jgi:Flp pilus assembly secretin CpaC
MATLAFDTYEFIKELKDVGFSEQQAEVITKLQKTTSANTLEQAKHDYELDNLVTKRDLKELELQLESRIKETELKIELVKAELKRDIEAVRKDMAENKAELVRWVVGVGLLQITIIAGLMFRLTGKM